MVVEAPPPITYYREQLHSLVWSGFFGPDDLEAHLEDLSYEAEAKPLLGALRTYAKIEFAAKREEERDWPATTDCDRLDAIFAQLTKGGILALANAGYTSSDAYGDAGAVIADSPKDQFKGFCFYHGQDVERAVGGYPLCVGFDATVDQADAKRAIGESVLAELKSGFSVDWNSDPETRMLITNLDWKRRTRWPTMQAATEPRGFLARLLGW